MAKGKRTAGRKNRGRKANDRSMGREVLAILMAALTVYLFLCNFGIGGGVGSALSGVMFGVFGLLAYAAPLLVALAAVFYVLNAGDGRAVRKIAAGIGLALTFGVSVDFVTGRLGAGEKTIAALYLECRTLRGGGGAVAGFVGQLLYRGLSAVGTVLLLLVAGVVCIVILTEYSLIDGVRRGGRHVAERAGADAREYRDKWQEQRQRMREEREQEAQERRERREQEAEERREKRAREDAERRERRAKEEEARKERQAQEAEARRQKEEAAETERILRTQKRTSGVTTATDLRRTAENEAAPQEQSAQVMQEAERTAAAASALQAASVQGDIHEITYTPPEGRAEEEGKRPDAPEGQAEAENAVPETESDSAAEAAEDAPRMRFTPAEEDGTREIRLTGAGRLHAAKRADTSMRELTVAAAGLPASQETAPVKPKRETLPSEAAQPSKAARQEPETATQTQAYTPPPLSLLRKPKGGAQAGQDSELRETAAKLEETLRVFGVNVKVTDISHGPSVTRYELQPEVGVKVSKIVGLSDDIKLNLAATDIRIEAPIPGKAAVGIEVPNRETTAVTLRELLESEEFQRFDSNLAFAVGKDIAGKVVVTDIAKMPHLLIAGATGSGKSVCINTLILSLIYKSSPEDVRLIMIDPKVVELSVYNGIPHLLIPVVTDPKKAASALNWAVAEMTNRYKKFADKEVRDLKGYNEYVTLHAAEDETLEKLPQIVVIVDELADMMMVSANEVEDAICRLAQLARAAGIHLIIATQRPSVDVITGLIKANMPSRLAFAVSSGTDSRTILDMNGAEKLLGKGDMLFYPQSYSKPVRIQGAFVSDREIQEITELLKQKHTEAEDGAARIQEQMESLSGEGGASGGRSAERDEYFADAGRFIIEKEKASIGMLQRVFKIGFNRAARIMDQLAEAGVVGEEEGTKPRKVLMSAEEFERFLSGGED